MLKIYFSGDDLARVRLATQPDPMWELVTSANKIFTSVGGITYNSWRSFARHALRNTKDANFPNIVHDLVPTRGDFPDFLTPTVGAAKAAAAVETVVNTSCSRLRQEIELIGQTRRLARWTNDLAAGKPETMRRLGDVLICYHHTLVRPYWPTIQAHVDADRALRARTVTDSGGEALLNSFRPTLRWNPPVLAADYPVDREIHLQGRGLTLIPSYFCWATPVALIDEDCASPVLLYPVDHDLTITAAAPFAPGGCRSDLRLGALIGRTRSQILITLADPHTTGQLARKFNVSAAAISQHTSVLRESGLIATRREANTAIHIATRLGAALCR